MISIQSQDFSVDCLYQAVKELAGNNAGAICTFTGLVREFDQAGQSKLTALLLEHYSGMTEQALTVIAEDATSRFSLSAIVIVHRIGKLLAGEQIVFVGTASEHRKSAFEGAQYIMDYLKNDAPFWKKEFRADGSENWIEQKQSDRSAKKQWAKKTAE